MSCDGLFLSFDPSRPDGTTYASFSVGSALTAPRQGATRVPSRVPSTGSLRSTTPHFGYRLLGTNVAYSYGFAVIKIFIFDARKHGEMEIEREIELRLTLSAKIAETTKIFFSRPRFSQIDRPGFWRQSPSLFHVQ